MVVSFGIRKTQEGYAVTRKAVTEGLMGPTWTKRAYARTFKVQLEELLASCVAELRDSVPWATIQRDTRHSLTYMTKMRLLVEDDPVLWCWEVDQLVLMLCLFAANESQVPMPPVMLESCREALENSYL